MIEDGFYLEPPQDLVVYQLIPWKRLMIDEEHYSPVPLKVMTDKKPDLENFPKKMIYKNGNTKIVFSDLKRPTENFPKEEVESFTATNKETGEKIEMYRWSLFAEREREYDSEELIREMRTAEGKLIHRFPPKERT